MAAVTDPNATMILEWSTGTTDNRKIQAVRLAIPPKSLKISRQKNVQKVVTTKGWVHNHGLENLPVISCSGMSYVPRNATQEGFDPKLAFAGLELLNSAYVSSGRLSSSPTLTSTLTTPLLSSPIEESDLTKFGEIVETISKRAEQLKSFSERMKQYGSVDKESGEFSIKTALLPKTSFPTTGITSLQNMILSEVNRDPTLVPSVASGIKSLMNNLNPSNVSVAQTQMSTFAQQTPSAQDLFEKFDFFYNKFKNDSSFSFFGLDPSVFTYIQQDPFLFNKANSAGTIAGHMQAARDEARKAIEESEKLGTNDWIITIIMYFQDMVYEGHFENFSMAESAEVLGLWQWDFTYVAHQSFVLKQNNVLPFDSAFDSSVTELSSQSNLLSYKDRFDVLDYVLSLSNGGNAVASSGLPNLPPTAKSIIDPNERIQIRGTTEEVIA